MIYKPSNLQPIRLNNSGKGVKTCIKFAASCILFLCVALTPLQAHWYKKASRTKKNPISHGQLTARIDWATRSQTNANISPQVQRALLNIVESSRWHQLRYRPITGTAFVFKTMHNGEEHLWGLTAGHYAFAKPSLKIPSHKKPIPVSFVARGTTSDLLLFKLPPETAQFVTPLSLAQEPAKVGDKVSCVGFFEKDLHSEENITITLNTPFRALLNLYTPPELDRTGECGSPILNKQNEVTGMFAGYSHKQPVAFVIPVQQIHQLVQAYWNKGILRQPLVFQGRTLSEININEQVVTVRTYAAGKPLLHQNTFHQEKDIDYAHLETITPPLLGADTVVFVLVRKPFSAQDSGKETSSLLIYHLHTGLVSMEPNAPSSRYYTPL